MKTVYGNTKLSFYRIYIIYLARNIENGFLLELWLRRRGNNFRTFELLSFLLWKSLEMGDGKEETMFLLEVKVSYCKGGAWFHIDAINCLLLGCSQGTSKWPCNPWQGLVLRMLIPGILELDLLAGNLIVGCLNDVYTEKDKNQLKRRCRPSLKSHVSTFPRDHKCVSIDIWWVRPVIQFNKVLFDSLSDAEEGLWQTCSSG